MRQKNVSMETIAQKLGVSRTTVHRALTNTGGISAGTRRRVSQMAEELGYRPNLLARGLRLQCSGFIGVVVTVLTSSFYAHVLEGIESTVRQKGGSLLLACSYARPDAERELVELFLEKAIDGLIVLPSDPEANRDYFSGLAAEGIPLVFVDRLMPGVDVDSVATDNLLGGYLAGCHLVQLGRKKIAFVATVSQERRTTSVQARLNGCNRALEESGREPATVLGPKVRDMLPEQRFAYEAVSEYLGSGGELDGVFAAHDGLAAGAMEALKEAGRQVPEEVAVVGFDDQDISAYLQPPLTTIRQPMRQIGEEACQLLFRRLAEDDGSPPRQRVSLKPTLIVRESCGGASKPLKL